MAAHWTDLYSFITGAVRHKQLGYLALSYDEASRAKIAVSNIAQWKPDSWVNGGQVDWRVTGAAVVNRPLEQLIVVGEFGNVLMAGKGDRHEETIESKDSSPVDRGPLRGVRRIGENVYVVGMDRQVYRRDDAGAWSSYDNGIDRDPNPKNISGFEAVDGFSGQEIYAVGWDGEIWSCASGHWTQESSPVGQVLLDVCCAGDGFVYACARNGLLLRGRRGQWETLDLGEFSESLWSLAWFKGNLYAASMDTVFMLDENGLLAPVHMGSDRAKTCYDLVAAEDVMWSIGAKDVMSFDGQQWIRID